MKKILFLITAFVLLFVHGGCTQLSSSDESINSTNNTQNGVIVNDASGGNDTLYVSESNANDVLDILGGSANNEETVNSAYVLSINSNDFSINLIAYLECNAHDISENHVSNSLLSLSQYELFRVPGDIGWWSHPLSLSGRSLVLPYEPVGVSALVYTIANDTELYYEDYVLAYDDEKSQAEISKENQSIARMSLVLDDVRYKPHAFFVINENEIALLCVTRSSMFEEEPSVSFDEIKVITLVYVRDGESYYLKTVNDHTSVFDDYDLVKLNMPNYTPLQTNVYGNAQSKTFIWNEGANIVEINPYDGSVNVLLTVSKIEADIPLLDTYREFYGFFQGAGYQNGIYLAMFPNYNNLAGTIVVFYSDKGEFLGNILCSDGSISFYDKYNDEIERMESVAIKPLLFIPQGEIILDEEETR